jgi:hypothetical protein
MSRRLAFLAIVALLAARPAALRAAEPLPPVEPAPVAAATIDLAAYRYIYDEFPRQMRSLQNHIALAEAEVAVAYDRFEGYRPFRSFGRYAATYTADQAAQLHLLALAQQLECLRDEEATLWRQRQAAAAQLLAR